MQIIHEMRVKEREMVLKHITYSDSPKKAVMSHSVKNTALEHILMDRKKSRRALTLFSIDEYVSLLNNHSQYLINSIEFYILLDGINS